MQNTIDLNNRNLFLTVLMAQSLRLRFPSEGFLPSLQPASHPLTGPSHGGEKREQASSLVSLPISTLIPSGGSHPHDLI